MVDSVAASQNSEPSSVAKKVLPNAHCIMHSTIAQFNQLHENLFFKCVNISGTYPGHCSYRSIKNKEGGREEVCYMGWVPFQWWGGDSPVTRVSDVLWRRVDKDIVDKTDKDIVDKVDKVDNADKVDKVDKDNVEKVDKDNVDKAAFCSLVLADQI